MQFPFETLKFEYRYLPTKYNQMIYVLQQYLLENRALQSPSPTDIMASRFLPLKYFMAAQTFLNDFACPLSLTHMG